MMNKFKTAEQLAAISRKLKKNGKKLVTINGSFDILHMGHIQLLKQAKAQGDFLAVLLNSDKSVRSYKGPKRPIFGQEERAEIMSALESVDFVCFFDEINPKKILDKIKPAIHCNGSDWGKNCVDRGIVEKNGGKLKIIKVRGNYSTSAIIQKIIAAYSTPVSKAVFLDRDGTINLDKQGYIHKIKDFEFVPKAIEALKKLARSDYKIIFITNQSGIGRGYFKELDMHRLHSYMKKQLKKHGVRIDGIYFCPHKPDDRCLCRKPATILAIQAAKDFGLSLNDSWVIGDKESDVVFGREVNAKTIKIGERMSKQLKLEPTFYAKNLNRAVDLILNVVSK